jgi:hypothetical protein
LQSLRSEGATGIRLAFHIAIFNCRINNFPLLVRLSISNFDFNQSTNNGSAIRFKTLSGAAIPFELEHWDATGKTAEFWVKMDTISGNSANQNFIMTWDDTAYAGPSNGAQVFDSSLGYRAVYHMGTLTDATPHANIGTNNGALSVAGIIGNARYFDGNAAITIPHSASLNITSDMTFSCWFSLSASATDWIYNQPRLWDKTRTSPTVEAAMNISLDRQNILGSGFSTVNPGVRLAGFDSPTYAFSTPGAISPSINNWQLLSITFSGGTAIFYINGIAQSTVTGCLPFNTDALYVTIGNSNAINRGFEGTIDELQLSTVAHSPVWIKLLYENQRQNQLLITIP